MLFRSTSLLLLLAASVYGQFQETETGDSTAAQVSSTPTATTTELDISEPTLWQMAAFAARAMSTKSRRFKLATLTAAEQTDSLFRLKVTLQRVNQGAPMDKNDLLFCTVEVRSNGNQGGQQQQWEVENFGCTLPAIVRRRRPAKKVAAAVTTPAPAQPELTTFEQPQSQSQLPQTSSQDSFTAYKYLAPVDNSIGVDGNSLEDLPPKRPVYKRQTAVSRPSYFPQYVQYSPQPQSSFRYLPMPSQYHQRPMNYYYQAAYY